MKQISLKEFNVSAVDDTGKERSILVTYKGLLTSALNTPPQDGFTLDEMDDRLKIKAKIEKANSYVNLDDNQANKLCDLALKQKFVMLDAGFVGYRDHLKKVKASEGK